MNKKETDQKLIQFLKEEKRFISDMQNIDTEENWIRFQNSVSKDKSKGNRTLGKKNRSLLIFKIAASITVLIAISLSVYYGSILPGKLVKQISAIDKNVEVNLSDGSKVFLNRGSQLIFNEKLHRNKREVTLLGEAFFEIKPFKKIPFYVHIEKSTVEVLETSFNIKQGDNGVIFVSVLSGKVRFFETLNVENSIMLLPGQRGAFNNCSAQFESESFNSDNFLYWKTDSLSFKHEPLDSVFMELEIYFQVEIIVNDNAILKNRLTTTCKDQQLFEILDEIVILFDIEYTARGDTIFIQSKHQ